MKLPQGDNAIIEDAKLVEYVLSPLHPVGKHHAYLFAKLMGIHRGNRIFLRNALEQAASNEEVSRRIVNPFGEKFEMVFSMQGPLGEARVRAIWIIENGNDRPRLVTCFVE